MVRPRKVKLVDFQPGITYFKPRAVPLADLEEVKLTFDELETMRLSNVEKLGQEEAAKRMGVHQSTFQRTLARAREKVTGALVNGKALKIEGGDYAMPQKDRMGRGRGMGGFFARGPGGTCICPNCRHEQPHIRGQSCAETKCQKCGKFMARK